MIFRYESLKEDDISRIKRMNSQMRYRGPDEDGLWWNEHCAMGHVRLSIIGLQNGTQPLFNRDKSVVLVCKLQI